MHSIVLEAPHRLALREADEPAAPGAGEALVRTLRVGVCGTDLHAYHGRQPMMRYPVVLGHELAVEVLELGPGAPDGLAPGDVCTVLPYLADGTCDACRRGRPNACEALEVLGVHRDGGMRERFTLPAGLLIPAPDLPLEAVALVEMLAVGAHAVARAAPAADDRVLVIGAGPIGLSVSAYARLRSRRVAVLERDEARRALVRELDLAGVVEPGVAEPGPIEHAGPSVGGADARPAGRPPAAPGADLEARVRGAFGGLLPTVILDATGSAASMEGAPALAAHGATLVLVGHTKGPLTFANPLLHGRELTLRASRNATREDMDTVLATLHDRSVDPLPWVTTRAGPSALVRDLPAWTRPGSGVVKAVLEMSTPAAAPPAGGRNGERA